MIFEQPIIEIELIETCDILTTSTFGEEALTGPADKTWVWDE